MTTLSPDAACPQARGHAAPHSGGDSRPDLVVPTDACDCHMHLYDANAPFAPGPVLRHVAATADDYRCLQRRLGTTRNVVVQPSSYGTDHRVLLAGLQALGASARGIAVVDPTFSTCDLRELDAAGVVGTRFNLVQAGATDAGMLERVAELIEPFGWHIQIHAHAADLIALESRIAALDVPVVIDHFARIGVDAALMGRLQEVLFRLLGSGRTWIKLSAPYIAATGEPSSVLASSAQQWFARFPERLVWGTDWPHVTEEAKPDDAALMGRLADWFSEAALQRILVDNPAHLYGFEAQP